MNLFSFHDTKNRVLDLGMTCTGLYFEKDYTNCDCEKARRRLAAGEIDCNVNRPCPDDCTVCQICLYYVVEECLDRSRNNS